VLLVSFCHAIRIIISGFLGPTEVRGFATVVTLIAFMQGPGIFLLGIIGEYVCRIFDEVNHRPESVVEAIY
jgi:hypothetical protein